MAIHYKLVGNHLVTHPEGKIARVLSKGVVDMEELAEHIVQRGSTVGKADILSVLEDYQSTVETLLRQGFTICTPAVNFRLAIQGTFEGDQDSFDPSRHRVVARASAGKRLRRSLTGQVPVIRLRVAPAQPFPEELVDVLSGTVNDLLTPNGMARLAGGNLRSDPADPEQGIFFLDSEEVGTRVEVLGENLPSRVIFMVPALAAGSYRLEVRTRPSADVEVRRGVLPAILTVS